MLTRKQQVFVEEYLNCWNASEAARRAGYKGDPHSVSSQVLANIGVAAELQARITERGIKAPEVLDKLTAHARSDIGQFFKESFRWSQWPLPTDEIVEEKEAPDPKHLGKMIKLYKCRRVVFDLDKMSDPQFSKLIRKFSDSPKSGISIEMHDAQAALEKLGKALGVLRENVNMSQDGPIEIVTRIVRKNGETGT